jgi:hypothetical protein
MPAVTVPVDPRRPRYDASPVPTPERFVRQLQAHEVVLRIVPVYPERKDCNEAAGMYGLHMERARVKE